MTKRGSVTVATSNGLVTIEIVNSLGAMRVSMTAAEARELVAKILGNVEEIETPGKDTP